MAQTQDEAVAHCLAKIAERIADGKGAPRAVLQIGYNLGRASELGGLGRALWDDWNGAVALWDEDAMRALLERLRESLGPSRPSGP